MIKPYQNKDGGLIAGIYEGISDADYQAIDALRASTMKEALQSPLQLRYRMNNKRPDSGALRVGRAVHLAVLQPDVYADEVAIIPTEFATTTGISRKKPAQEWAASVPDGVTVITEAEEANVQGMAQAVFHHATADTMLQASQGREVTALWEEVTPKGARVWCKARADALCGGMLVDLKSTRETAKFNPRRIGGVIAKFGYAYQLGWYSRGLFAAAVQSGIDPEPYMDLGWGLIFVQSSAPYDVIACMADDEMQDIGRMDAEAVWEAYATAADSGIWPGVAPELVTVSLPRWAVPKEDDDIGGLGLSGMEVMG